VSCADAMPDHRHGPRSRPQPARPAPPGDDRRTARTRGVLIIQNKFWTETQF
jgi:hypothetical protein